MTDRPMIATTVATDREWHVTSATHDAVIYVVKRFSDDTMSCNCDAFYYARTDPRSCKHTRLVRDAYGFDDVPVADRRAQRLADARAEATRMLTTRRPD